MILPIYLPPGAEAPPGANDLAESNDPQRNRRTISVVLRQLDVAAQVGAALLALRRVGFTSTGDGGWRVRRNYEAHFSDDGEPAGVLACHLGLVAESAALLAVCEPTSAARTWALEGRIFRAACWLLWGEPRAGEAWGVDAVARDLAAECGVDVCPQYALSAARDRLEQPEARLA
ncbi:hypothetical protein WMF38_57365 [Sorangium sp. So ce118]